MPMNSSSLDLSPQLQQASIYSDLNSLDSIRKMGRTDEAGAMKKAAKEFEAFFMNMMLKSMRQSSEVIGENPLTGSPQEKMFTAMMDEQMAVDLSQKGLLGIADLMMSQFYQAKGKTPGSPEMLNAPLPQFSGNVPAAHSLSSQVAAAKALQTENIAPARLPEHAPKAEQKKIEKVKVEKKALFSQAEEFISSLLPYAKNAARKLDLDPKLLIAQAALETGWGKFIMHDDAGKPGYNLFGIKAGKSWQGESIKIDTLEVENQQFKKVKASFRKYQNFAQSFDDYVDFVKQDPRYSKAVSLRKKPAEYIEQLQKSGYATDPNYASKIMSIFKENILNKAGAGAMRKGYEL